jgi:TPR repeat protein
LCRGPFSNILAETLLLDAKKAFNVIHSMADKGQITWAALPPAVKARMRSILRKFMEAANCGHARAEYNLGLIYNSGQGVRQDFKEAVNGIGKQLTKEMQRLHLI